MLGALACLKTQDILLHPYRFSAPQDLRFSSLENHPNETLIVMGQRKTGNDGGEGGRRHDEMPPTSMCLLGGVFVEYRPGPIFFHDKKNQLTFRTIYERRDRWKMRELIVSRIILFILE